MRYFVVRDEGLGPFVVAEVTEGVLDVVRGVWPVLREDEAARRYPAAVLAWRSGQDRVAFASRAFDGRRGERAPVG